MATPKTTDKKADKPAKTSTVKKEKEAVDLSPAGKSARFTKIAGRRTKEIIRVLSNLGNCSNRNVYGYTPTQIDYIFEAIDKQVKDTKAKFAEKIAPKKTDFDLEKAPAV